MVYRTTDYVTWAVRAAAYMEANGHTTADTPCNREALAEACEFPVCQWYRVKQHMISAGYKVGVRPGRSGGFYLGEHGCQASHLVYTDQYVESRLNTSQRQEQDLKALPGWNQILRFARERLSYDLTQGARRIQGKAQQLALPMPQADVPEEAAQ